MSNGPLKGYPSIDRDLSLGTTETYVTGEPVRSKQHGQSTISHQFVREIGTDAVEAASTTTVINATAHSAQRGDVINFTSGNLSGHEAKVKSVTANAITLAEVLSEAPAASDTFQILRHKYPLINADGTQSFSASLSDMAPTEFVLDASDVQVNKDTGTPANNRPLPMELLDTTGVIDMRQGVADLSTLAGAVSGSEMQVDIVSAPTLDVSATDLDIRDLTHASDSVRLGDGTDLTDVTSGELHVRDVTAQTSLSTIAGAVSGSEMQVDIVSAPTLTVSATDLDIRDLAHTQDSVRIGDGVELANVNASNELQVRDDDANTSLTSLAGTVSGSELQVDIVSAPTLTVSATDLDIRDLSASQDNVAISDGTDTLAIEADGSINVNATAANLDVIDFARLDYSSTNVTTGAYVELEASTAAATKKLHIFDSSGQTLYLAVGAAASEVDQMYIIPGGNGEIEIDIPASSRISLKAVSGTADAGEIVINFLG